MSDKRRIIIIGAGFGGLGVATKLAKEDVEVLIVDRQNFHTFTPLIYQVATCALDPSEVAYPVRGLFQRERNVSFRLGEVTGIDVAAQQLTISQGGETHVEAYDYLVIAAGSTPTYYGNENIQQHSHVLDELTDAVDLRNHILKAFEEAVWEDDPAKREALTTIVVVGGGPTGLETAGAIYELYTHVLNKEFTERKLQTRVLLVELQEHLLGAYPMGLRKSAESQLRSLGVEVILGNGVESVAADSVTLSDGTVIPTHTLVWAAGVKGSPLAELLGVELTRAGRIPIARTTNVLNASNVYAVGDIAHLEDESGKPYPMVIPVAQQQADTAAHNIMATIKGEPTRNFHYRDRGSMATIGRSRAVAWLYNRVPVSGRLAWLAWLGLHLVTLVGFRNRLNVLVNWLWNYLTYDRSARVLLDR